MQKHELNIFTNDGWVVTLIADKRIDLGDTIISSIIVQPVEDHDKRCANEVGQPGEPDRQVYKLKMVRE